MCKYCNFEFDENGETWDAAREIWTEKEDLGISAEIVLKTSIFVLSNSHRRQYQLNCDVSVGNSLDDTIFDNYIPISYCPFCGRKFENTEEVEF